MPKISMAVLGTCITSKKLDPKWKVFPSILSGKGISVVPVGDSSSTHYFALEHSDKSLSKIDKIVDRKHRHLIIVEPKAVHPRQYIESVRNNYGHVLALSRRHLFGAEGEIWHGGHIDIPSNVISEVEISKNFYRKPKTIGLINENKFSLIPGSLYKKRYLVIKEFLERDQEFHLAGRNWGKGNIWSLAKNIHAGTMALRSQQIPRLNECRLSLDIDNPLLKYHGRVSSQLEFLRSLVFAVVIENEPTYLTEKLLNAIIAGCVPLFLGPPLSEFGVPDDVAVQVNGIKGSFYEAFRYSNPDQIASVLLKGRNWITNPETLDRWGVLSGFDRLSARIKELATE